MIKIAIDKIVRGEDLTELETERVMTEIMEGETQPSQIAAFITALRMKGETVPEITGAAVVMRRKAVPVHTKQKDLVDTCGTGGDGSQTFNISTISALVAAGAGVAVAKHGNRSVSSRCGSADLFQELGVNIEAPVETVEKCLDEIGIGFLYAPLMHKAMKYAIGPRREIGIRTIFNILGPLTNPAGAGAQVLGVYEPELTGILAQVLGNLGCREAWVVHGNDGLDEITTTGPTKVGRWYNNQLEQFEIKPEELGIKRAKDKDLKGGDTEQNVSIAHRVLAGDKGPQRDIVVLNAAAAIVCGQKAKDISEGIKQAEVAIDSGKAMEKLDKLIKLTGGKKSDT